jgi:hypothetical protein
MFRFCKASRFSGALTIFGFLLCNDLPAQDKVTVPLFKEEGQPTSPSGPFSKGIGRLVVLADTFISQAKGSTRSDFTLLVNLKLSGVSDVRMSANIEPLEWLGYQRLIARDEEGSSGLIGTLSEKGLTALIEISSQIFRIEPITETVHKVYEIDSQKFLPEAPALVPPQRGGALPLKLCDELLPFPIPIGKGPRVRFLALFTPSAAAQVGDVNAEIITAFELTRQAFQASRNFIVTPELAAIELVNLVETDTLTDLNRLTDGAIAGVHDRRNANRADLVTVFTTHSDACGRAWKNEQPDSTHSNYAYAVVNIGCAVSNKSAPHEIGHNFGMDHDRANAGPSSLGYNYGYIIFSQRLRSLMSYDDECIKRGFSCKRVNVYSSPNFIIKGDALGVPIGAPGAAHNMEVLCRNSSILEAWRTP